MLLYLHNISIIKTVCLNLAHVNNDCVHPASFFNPPNPPYVYVVNLAEKESAKYITNFPKIPIVFVWSLFHQYTGTTTIHFTQTASSAFYL